ncbi:MAG: outer membrane channel protein TolC, partial [Aeromonas veronii]
KLYDAKQKLSAARYNYILNILSLKQAAGILEAKDLVEVNQGLMPASAKG